MAIEKEKKTQFRLDIWLSIFLGVLSFFVGFLYFFPLEALARELILRLWSESTFIEFRKIDFSFWGRFELTELRISNESVETKSELYFPVIRGRISPWALLFGNKLSLNAELNSVQIRQRDLKIRFGDLKAQLQVANIRKNPNLYQGDVQIEGNSIIFEYEKEVPILNEKVEVPINFLELKAKLEQGFWQVKKGHLESRLALVEIQGRAPLTTQAIIDIELIIEPKEELYQKYQDRGLKEILNNFKLLQPDGKIRIKLMGTLAKPELKPVSMN